MKTFYIFLGMVFAVGALVFWREIAALIVGMSPLEILKQIAAFALHAAWITLLGFLVTTLPKMVRPWLRTFRWKQRQARRNGRFSVSAVQPVKAPKFDANKALLAMLSKQSGVREIRQTADPATDIKLDM